MEWFSSYLAEPTFWISLGGVPQGSVIVLWFAMFLLAPFLGNMEFCLSVLNADSSQI